MYCLQKFYPIIFIFTLMSDGNHIPAKNASLKYIALATPVLLFILMAGSVLFYKERMLYIDAPHVLFRLINDGHFWIEEHRYGSFISQVLPLIGAKLHFPLRVLMLLYSVSFYVFYLSVALILIYGYRNYVLAILLGLYFILFVSESYYWPNNEVHQGIAWLLLIFGANFSIAAKKRPLIYTTLLFTASFFLAVWTHPLVMLAGVYLWFFFMADKATWPFTKIQSVLFSVILLILAYIKFHQGMHHGYDSSKIEALTQFQFRKIKTIFDSPALHFLLRNTLKGFLLIPMIFLAGIIGLLKEKKYLQLIWTIGFVCGYVILTCITFWDVTSCSYLECEYMPLVIIGCAPFVCYVLPKMNVRLAVGLFACMYILYLINIYNAAPPFKNRLAILERINEKMKEKNFTKIIIQEPEPYADSALINNWAAPVESIFISKLNGEVPQRTFIFFNTDEIKNYSTLAKDTLLGSFEKRSVSHIDSCYFQMDTTTKYTVVTYSELMK